MGLDLNLPLVMLGGAIGAALRYQVGRVTLHHIGPGFPWGTLIVNLAGGLFMGILAAVIISENPVDRPLWLFFGVGVLGGFTTFSAFSLDLFVLLQRGQLSLAAAYVTLSVLGSFALLMAGYWLTKSAS